MNFNAETEEHAFIPADFGVDDGCINRYLSALVCSKTDERHQLNILREECVELNKAVSTVQQLRDAFSKANTVFEAQRIIDEWFEARANLAKELAHIATLSAVVSRIMNVSQKDIDHEVQCLDKLLPTKKETNS